MNFQFLDLYSSNTLIIMKFIIKSISINQNEYIHWLSGHLASLQVLDVLEVDDGFCLPDLSSWVRALLQR